MPNRFARAVPIDGYHPKGLLPDGLLPVARPDGSFETEMANASGRLAATMGAIADDAAKAEGAEAGKIAGLDPHYRPDGSLTIRGKAFNDAATQTYTNNLDARLRGDLQQVYEANKDDPAALKRSLDALYARYTGKDGDVFDGIRGDFNAQFARLRLPYENKALANLEENTHAANRASLIESTTARLTNVARMAAADPTNPQTARTIAIEADEHAREVDLQVERRDIPADVGAKQKIKFRDTAVTAAALARADTLTTPEAVAAYRDNVRKKFAAGEFKGLSADGYDTLDAGLKQLQAARRTEITAGAAQLGKHIDDYVERVAGGLPVSEAEWTAFATSDAAKTPKGAALLQSGDAKVRLATVMSKLPIEDAGRLVEGLRREAGKDGNVSSAGAAVVQFAEDQLKKQRTALNTDQLGYAAQRRMIPAVAPIDFQGFAASDDPAAASVLAAQFRNRTAQARAVGVELSRAPQFLRPDETERMKEIVALGGDRALALAGAIVKGAGMDAPAVLREISGDAPLLAQSGRIIASGGSQAAARDALEYNRLRANKLDPVTPADSITAAADRDTLGQAYRRVPEGAGYVRTMANAIAGARITRDGVDPKGSEAEKIYKRALLEASGARFAGDVQFGGVASYSTGFWGTKGQTVVPTGIRADALRDVIRTLTDDDIAALPVKPEAPGRKPYGLRDITGAFPVAVPGGYRMAIGDPTSDTPRFIAGSDGKPFLLPFDMLERIASRVPGASLGSE